MNKEIIDCIRAEKEKELQARKEKEEKIQKIKEFFKDLPEGTYRIATTIPIEEKIREHWYSRRSHIYTNYKRKEPWLSPSIDHITIKIDDKVKISEGVGNHEFEISRWDYNVIKTFYEHLNWFEKELGKEYCKGKA
jgi:hypothetical protein